MNDEKIIFEFHSSFETDEFCKVTNKADNTQIIIDKQTNKWVLVDKLKYKQIDLMKIIVENLPCNFNDVVLNRGDCYKKDLIFKRK